MLGKLVSRLIFNLTPGHLAALFGPILADIIKPGPDLLRMPVSYQCRR
jgi:hypothetical protein